MVIKVTKTILSYLLIGPKICGRPERPPNSTILATSFEVGSVIEYKCDLGNLLIGPNIRTCLPTGFFSEYSPRCKCKFVLFLISYYICLLDSMNVYYP